MALESRTETATTSTPTPTSTSTAKQNDKNNHNNNNCRRSSLREFRAVKVTVRRTYVITSTSSARRLRSANRELAPLVSPAFTDLLRSSRSMISLSQLASRSKFASFQSSGASQHCKKGELDVKSFRRLQSKSATQNL